MLIFPEIQISDAQVVTRSTRTSKNIFHDMDPFTTAMDYVEQGAERLHLLDVDAAIGRETGNAEIIRKIIDNTHIPVQVAGGMRTVDHIDTWLEAGAAHVVLGTLAITSQALLAEVCTRHPGAILANVATKSGHVMIDGWQTQTAFSPLDIVYDLQMAGVAGIIHFDIDRFEGEAATALALTMEMKKQVVIPVYSSGTVHSLDDVARLRYLPDIYGAIICKALLDGTCNLTEVLEVACQRDPSTDLAPESTLSRDGIQTATKVYMAAYNLSPSMRWWNRDLRQAITDANPYIDLVIPQDDLQLDIGNMTNREIQAAWEQVLDDADTVIVVLDGVAHEAWTAFECGYARAKGKYLLGIASTEIDVGRTTIEAMCDEVVFYDPEEDRLAVIQSIAKQVNTLLVATGADTQGEAGGEQEKTAT